MQEFSRRLALPEDVLDHWLGLLFVSKRTECITGLIYYPFLILALLVVSRNRTFANFSPSLAMVAVTGISVLILIGCAVALHWSAETSRTQARAQLNDEIVKAMSLKDEGRRANQLQMMLRRVDELREGAFSPFSQQPLVRAILLPLGGLGGSTLLEYLSSSGLIG
jgi:membrane protein implicated in regulation of membrane protease activity